MKYNSKEYFYKENKYWNVDLNKWVHGWKLENSKYKFPDKFKIISYPAIYTLEDIKKEYPNRWLIPTSPEIIIKYNNKLYKITELKDIW